MSAFIWILLTIPNIHDFSSPFFFLKHMDPGTVLYSRLSHAYVTTLISVTTGQNVPLDVLLQQCKYPLSPQCSHTLKSCWAGPSMRSSFIPLVLCLKHGIQCSCNTLAFLFLPFLLFVNCPFSFIVHISPWYLPTLPTTAFCSLTSSIYNITSTVIC